MRLVDRPVIKSSKLYHLRVIGHLTEKNVYHSLIKEDVYERTIGIDNSRIVGKMIESLFIHLKQIICLVLNHFVINWKNTMLYGEIQDIRLSS